MKILAPLGAVILLTATACFTDKPNAPAADPTSPSAAVVDAAASEAVDPNTASVCASFGKERAMRALAAKTGRGAEAEAARADVESLDALMADVCK